MTFRYVVIKQFARVRENMSVIEVEETKDKFLEVLKNYAFYF
jgi:hypothetical protein